MANNKKVSNQTEEPLQDIENPETVTDIQEDLPDTENLTSAQSPQRNEEYVDYCLPFMEGKRKGDSQTVTVNGKNYQVQYGIPTKVPIAVYSILQEMVAQSEILDKKIKALTEKEKCIATIRNE